MLRPHFRCLSRAGLRPVATRAPLGEISGSHLPGVYLTRKGSHPIAVLRREDEAVELRLWDGREVRCDLETFARTVQSEGWFATKPIGLRGILRTFSSLPSGPWRRGIMGGSLSGLLLVWFLAVLHGLLHRDGEPVSPVPVALASAGTALFLCGFFRLRARLHRSGPGRSRAGESESRITALAGELGRRLAEGVAGGAVLAAAAAGIIIREGDPFAWVTGAAGILAGSILLSWLPEWRCRFLELAWLLGIGRHTAGKAAAPPSALRLHNVLLEHPDEKSAPLLDHVSLTVRPGEKVLLRAENGREVRLLFRMIQGGLNPDRGMIWVGGRTMIPGQTVEGLGFFGADRDGFPECAAPAGAGQTVETAEREAFARLIRGGASLVLIEVNEELLTRPWFRRVLAELLRDRTRTVLLGGSGCEEWRSIGRIVTLKSGRVEEDRRTGDAGVLREEELAGVVG